MFDCLDKLLPVCAIKDVTSDLCVGSAFTNLDVFQPMCGFYVGQPMAIIYTGETNVLQLTQTENN